jgi:magnesium-transporting ATPase (P-type)
MNQPPRIKSEIITKPLLIFMLIAGILMTIGAVGIFFFMTNILQTALPVARTTVFVTMTLFAIVNAFNFRSFRKLVFNRSLFVNKYLFYASITSIVSTLLIIYTPLNKTFELVPIGWIEWFSATILALLLIIIMDILKFLNNKYKIIDRHEK